MRELFEVTFYLLYLAIIISVGIVMVRRCHRGAARQYWLFAVAAIMLGVGDACYLLPRSYALSIGKLEVNTLVTGIGLLIAILTHAAFYIMLYHVARIRYDMQGHHILTLLAYLFAALTFFLHSLPQNNWLTNSPPWLLGVIRNIPYVALGLLDILVYYRESTIHNDGHFRFMASAIACNYGCYIPVVVWVAFAPSLWVLMIPQACTFLWIIIQGFRALSSEIK